ncbi:inositol monophosphatase family protein [Acinetobacter sp. TUM15512]|uniref:inositol monophosphatase family protein n=1 Tax=Acinetobacter sp. TUM15512 TaxID=2609155 RepID=UPI00125E7046|nr:inositol monophosphatase family protein [Acinetobacter sp. TUM15512]
MKIIDFIIFNETNNTLYIQKRSKDRRIFPDQWETPGGHLEEGETIVECLFRELKEETNLSLTCIYGKVNEFIWSDKKTINSVYLISAEGNLEVEREKVSEYLWINKFQLEEIFLNNKNDIYQSFSNAFELIESKKKVKQKVMDNIFIWLDGVKNIKEKYFKNIDLEKTNKPDGSPVSIADKEIESFLHLEIKKKFPSHNYIGEENEYNYDSSNFFKWIVDPIDGTRSFIVGRPTFGTLISLVYKNIPIFGCIYQPVTNEKWIAFLGDPLYYNSNRVNISTPNINKDIESFVPAPEVFKSKKEINVFENLKKISKRISYNGDCYAYGLLSMGFVDIIIEQELHEYDYSALLPILNASKSLYFSLDGVPIDISNSSTSLIAFKAHSFLQLIELVK